jgi:hypothetical protein
MVKYNKKRFCLEGYRRAMTEGLVDSDWNYSNRSVGKKTKPQKAQLCFAQKTLRLAKTIRMICNCYTQASDLPYEMIARQLKRK